MSTINDCIANVQTNARLDQTSFNGVEPTQIDLPPGIGI